MVICGVLTGRECRGIRREGSCGIIVMRLFWWAFPGGRIGENCWRRTGTKRKWIIDGRREWRLGNLGGKMESI